ncbi:MAG: DUF4416 family protein [Gemmataceae bacterium]
MAIMVDSISQSEESAEPGGVELKRPVLLIIAVFSRHSDALSWAKQSLESSYGPVGLVSDPFSFHHTTYYAETMGRELLKQFLAFERLVPEDCLSATKRHTILLEQKLIAEQRFEETRPVNIDPGILTLGKFLLATTKDQQHRIYLRDGIFAEVTLKFQGGRFHLWPWTYADYREPLLLEWLLEAREFYKGRLADYRRRQDHTDKAQLQELLELADPTDPIDDL